MLWLPLLVNGLVSGCALGMVAVSFSLIFATTKVFHVAHAGVYSLGGYLAWSALRWGAPAPVGLGAYAWVLWFAHRTQLGRRMRAVASNPFLAEITGLDPRGAHVAVMVIGSALVCLPGTLVPLDLGLQPFGGLPMLLTATIAMIAGGVGSITGAFVLAIAIAVLQNLSLLVIPGEWSIGVTFFIFVIFMLFRPRGLFAG